MKLFLAILFLVLLAASLAYQIYALDHQRDKKVFVLQAIMTTLAYLGIVMVIYGIEIVSIAKILHILIPWT
ncbi:hypothetical protein [Caldalkalibacillus salinus]|uniref:hypothetical protein n=1 Tax=Caldalkalibacillus salinus TaxID=2803787 RepID=UPI0019225E5D|nr:hypothetical protein [Caldalkalibacillus salinus]